MALHTAIGRSLWRITPDHNRDRIVREFKQQEAMDFIGRKVNQHNTQGQTTAELTNAILEEWRRFPQEKLRRLVRGMNRQVRELWRTRGGYTHY